MFTLLAGAQHGCSFKESFPCRAYVAVQAGGSGAF